MNRILRSLGFLFFSLFALLGGSYAAAVVISGSFTGNVVNFMGPPFYVHDGDPVTGIFSIDTGYPYWRGNTSANYASFNWNSRSDPSPPPPPVYIGVYGPKNDIYDRYEVAGDVVDIEMFQDASTQWIKIATGYGGYCCGASIVLAGAPGSLFDSFDPASLHAGPVDLEASLASYASKGTMRFDVAFSSVTFDGATVPEPTGLALFALSVGILGLFKRKGPAGRADV